MQGPKAKKSRTIRNLQVRLRKAAPAEAKSFQCNANTASTKTQTNLDQAPTAPTQAPKGARHVYKCYSQWEKAPTMNISQVKTRAESRAPAPRQTPKKSTKTGFTCWST
jgi:hypothetical protein